MAFDTVRLISTNKKDTDTFVILSALRRNGELIL
jgi:hypothetical protein